MWEKRIENNSVDTTGEERRGLQDENFTQTQARKEPSVVMIWTDQKESCLDTSTLNLLSLSL